jgi:predicted DNA-binding protein
MSKTTPERKPGRRGQAVLLTLPPEMMQDLDAEARRLTLPVAAVARMIIAEHLEHIRASRR